jgi:hypothetical protein
METIEKKKLGITAFICYTFVIGSAVPIYTAGMDFVCEITYPVGESINGGIMMTMSQLSGIGGTFLCDHFINNYKEKPWISNVILLIFFVISCVFVFLFDEKLDRQEVEQAGRIKEDEDKKIEPVTVEVQGQSN